MSEYLILAVALISGFFLLWKGGEYVVDAAQAIAHHFRIPEFVIGLTLVALGTSLPEMVVNIVASIEHKPDIVLGNILGSNISNTLLILGIAGLVGPLPFLRSTLLKEIPFGIVAVAVVYVLFNDIGFSTGFSGLDTVDGVVLASLLVGFIGYLIKSGRESEIDTDPHYTPHPKIVAATYFVLGGISLPIGAKLVVWSAVELSLIFGMSQAFVSLFLVAFGTSLPELFASTVAIVKGRGSIAVGNVVGSNILNIVLVLAMSVLIRPIPFNGLFNFDMWVFMCSSAILVFLIQMSRRHLLNRLHAWLLLATYLVYIGVIYIRG